MSEETTVPLRRRRSIASLKAPGDYCFPDGPGTILACPKCGTVFYCGHTIIQRDPLTLSPSIVGPTDASWKAGDPYDQILGPCLHHFWVKDGVALEVQ